jgi:NADH-quinone oxidoreductase subunit M
MILLPSLIAILIVGGFLAWIVGQRDSVWSRWVSLVTILVSGFLTLWIWFQFLGNQSGLLQEGEWLLELNWPWIPQLGINFHLALDGLSLLMLLLVHFVGIIAVVASWVGIKDRVGFFHFNLLWILAALVGVFLAADLFLFYFFWELMLVPLYFIIGIWGHERRVFATLKFFIYTQASSLLMLIAFLALYFLHGQSTGVYTFEYNELLGTSIASPLAFWLMLGTFVAFAVKLSAVPVHAWLPDAHTQAPTAGSVYLAGLVLKVGAYGIIRFTVPLFFQAAIDFAPIAMILGVAGILYGAILAFVQADFKRLVAYTSISHMGFVLLGIFAWNQLALQGTVIIMIAHGLSTGALFVLVGVLNERTQTRQLSRLGGLWAVMPRAGKVGLILALASLGLPGMANFVGEFLVLQGVYQVNSLMAILATLGFVVSTVYSLWMIQRVFAGPNHEGWKLKDLDKREMAMFVAMIAVIFWFGLYPKPVFRTFGPAFENLQKITNSYKQSQRILQNEEFSLKEPETTSRLPFSGSEGGSP